MKKLLLLTAALFLAAVPARADTFTADTAAVLNGQNITLFTPHFVNTQAGEIKLHSVATNTDLLVWCLDVFDGISLPYTYQVNVFHAGDIRPGIANLNASQVRQIAALMVLGNTMFSDAAVQLAIWRVEYGALFTSSASGALLADSTLAMTDTQNGGILDCSNCVLTVLTDAPANPSQAFGYASVQLAVPGPLVGTGLPGIIAACAAMVGFHRRRRNRLMGA